jgi:hypothetical protein
MGKLDDTLIDAPEEGGKFFIASDLVLSGGFFWAHNVADPVKPADNGNEAVDLRLVDPAAIGERLAAGRFQAVDQHGGGGANPLGEIRRRRAPELPALLRRLPDEGVQRALRGIGEQGERRLGALGKRTQRHALRERQIPFHENPA